MPIISPLLIFYIRFQYSRAKKRKDTERFHVIQLIELLNCASFCESNRIGLDLIELDGLKIEKKTHT